MMTAMAKPETKGGARHSLGALIKRASGEAGLSLIELAEQIGVSRPTIYAYVGDKLPIPEARLLRIAQATGKTIEYFLDGPRGPLDEASITRSKLELIDAYLSPADPKRASDLADEVLRSVEEHHDLKAEATVLHRSGTALVQSGDFASAVGKLDRARRLFERDEDLAMAAKSSQTLGLAYTNLGQLDRARECFEFSQSNAEKGAQWKGAVSLAALAERQGDFAGAYAILDILDADPQISSVARAYILANRASALLSQGRWRDSLEVNEKAFQLSLKLGLTDQQIELTLQRGQARIAIGDWENGSLDIATGKAMARVTGDSSRLVLATIWESVLLARCGELEEARNSARNALDQAVRSKLRRSESLALLTLAEISARREQFEAMEDFAMQADSHAQTYGYVQAQAAATVWLALAGRTGSTERYRRTVETYSLRSIGWAPGSEGIFKAIEARDTLALEEFVHRSATDENLADFSLLNFGLLSLVPSVIQKPTDKIGKEKLSVWRVSPSGMTKVSVVPVPLPWKQLSHRNTV